MFVDAWIAVAPIVLALMTAVWLLSLRLRNAGIVDVAWGPGFALIAWSVAALAPSPPAPRTWLAGLLVTAWALRLAAHIFVRSRGAGEDYRYRAWRERAGTTWWWRSYFKVFLLQGAVMWVVGAPLVAVASRATQAPLGWLDALGAAVWAAGFVFETVGDRQLARFKADPANRGRLMRSGLWRYTRHPNYFGDATVWWGVYLLAAASGAWWSLFGPALMTYLLVRVSGVKMLETSLRVTKPGYRDYEETTSAFIPRPPRRSARGPTRPASDPESRASC